MPSIRFSEDTIAQELASWDESTSLQVWAEQGSGGLWDVCVLGASMCNPEGVVGVPAQGALVDGECDTEEVEAWAEVLLERLKFRLEQELEDCADCGWDDAWPT